MNMSEGETIADFIKLSGGLLHDALKDTIEVVSFQPGGKVDKPVLLL